MLFLHISDGQAGEGGLLLYDRQSGESTYVGRDQRARFAGLSPDGMYVGFYGDWDNHNAVDFWDHNSPYLYDVASGSIQRIEVSASPKGGREDRIQISAGGRYIAFSSYASTVVPNDTNSASDVFVHDRGGP